MFDVWVIFYQNVGVMELFDFHSRSSTNTIGQYSEWFVDILSYDAKHFFCNDSISVSEGGSRGGGGIMFRKCSCLGEFDCELNSNNGLDGEVLRDLFASIHCFKTTVPNCDEFFCFF